MENLSNIASNQTNSATELDPVSNEQMNRSSNDLNSNKNYSNNNRYKRSNRNNYSNNNNNNNTNGFNSNNNNNNGYNNNYDSYSNLNNNRQSYNSHNNNNRSNRYNNDNSSRYNYDKNYSNNLNFQYSNQYPDRYDNYNQVYPSNQPNYGQQEFYDNTDHFNRHAFNNQYSNDQNYGQQSYHNTIKNPQDNKNNASKSNRRGKQIQGKNINFEGSNLSNGLNGFDNQRSSFNQFDSNSLPGTSNSINYPKTVDKPKQRQNNERQKSSKNENQVEAKKVASTKASDLTRSEILIEQIKKNKCECMVCCQNIRSDKAVWSCSVCFHIFHLYCIKKWANSPSAKIEETSDKWRCPGCQTIHDLVPSKYTLSF